MEKVSTADVIVSRFDIRTSLNQLLNVYLLLQI